MSRIEGIRCHCSFLLLARIFFPVRPVRAFTQEPDVPPLFQKAEPDLCADRTAVCRVRALCSHVGRIRELLPPSRARSHLHPAGWSKQRFPHVRAQDSLSKIRGVGLVNLLASVYTVQCLAETLKRCALRRLHGCLCCRCSTFPSRGPTSRPLPTCQPRAHHERHLNALCPPYSASGCTERDAAPPRRWLTYVQLILVKFTHHASSLQEFYTKEAPPTPRRALRANACVTRNPFMSSATPRVCGGL